MNALNTSLQRSKRSHCVSIVLWCVLLPACLVSGLGWTISGSIYVLDLILAHQLLMAWGVLGCVLVGLLLRRWRWSSLALLLLGLSVWPVMLGRVMTLPRVDFASKDEAVIRVLTSNINPKSAFWAEDLDALLDLDADVIVLIEIPPELNRRIRRFGRLDGTRYSGWVHREWVDQETSPGFILSRWPIEREVTGTDPQIAQHVLHTRVQTPAGEVIVGLVHPLSPRSAERWRQGNAAVEIQASAIEHTLMQSGLPLLIGADLNATPAQWRTRMLRSSGVRMSKPLVRFGGSFPAGSAVPEAFKIQLDDVWYAGAVRPIAWEMLDLRGSDHRAIVVDFELLSE